MAMKTFDPAAPLSSGVGGLTSRIVQNREKICHGNNAIGLVFSFVSHERLGAREAFYVF